MKHIKLLLLALPLLLCGCDNKPTNTTKSEPAYKQEFYQYIEKNYPSTYVISVEFNKTEAKTFGYDYYSAIIYYTDGQVHKHEYLLCVNEKGSIYQLAEVK